MGSLQSAVLAAALTLALGPPVLWILRRRNILDLPNERSSHDRPTTRGGGLAPAIGGTVALFLCSQVGATIGVGILVVALTMGVIGLLDDLWSLEAVHRLTAQVVVATASLAWLASSFRGPLPWRAVFGAGVVVWLVGYVNAFNFMDGINGLAVAQLVVAGVTWWAIGHHQHVGSLAAGGLVAAAVAVGFAPFNVLRPRMFLGDVGSYFLGGYLAAFAVVGIRSRLTPEAVLAPLAIYVADTVMTLTIRIRRHETWYCAHREHAYQRLVQFGWSHPQTALFAGGAMATCAALGSISLTGSLPARAVADGLACAVVVVYLSSPALVARRRNAMMRL